MNNYVTKVILSDFKAANKTLKDNDSSNLNPSFTQALTHTGF
ncbi:hypothetical protein [Shewanella morhuae]|nr:hypothetical protein [Shewanella morhuae]